MIRHSASLLFASGDDAVRQRVLDQIAAIVRHAAGCEVAAFCLYGTPDAPVPHELVPVELGPNELDADRIDSRAARPAAISAISQALPAGIAVPAPETAIDPAAMARLGFALYVEVPIKSQDIAPMGTLAIANRASQPFSDDQLELLKMSARLIADMITA